MRRVLAIILGFGLVAAGCSSDQGNSGSTTTGPQEPPTVNVASGAQTVASDDQRTLPNAFGNSITLNDVDTGDAIDPDPGTQTALWLSSPRWRSVSAGGDECAIANGQIVISRTQADDLGLETLGDESFGTLGGQDIVLAKVDPGTELAVITDAIELGGLASFHYPVLPQPRWDYGPASDPFPIPQSSQVSGAIGTTGDPVYVIDYFGLAAESPRVIDQEVETYLGLYGLNLNEAELMEFTEGLMEANDAIAGHGEFIGGILDRLGVAWESEHVGLTGDRVTDENAIAGAINNADHSKIAVTNLSMGIEPCEVTWTIGGEVLKDSDDNPLLITMTPLAITAAMSQRAQGFSAQDPPVDSYFVAAAGNHGSPGKDAECVAPWFPARFAAGMSAWSTYYDALEWAAALPDDGVVTDPTKTVNLAKLDADIVVLEQSTVSVGATAVPDPAGGDANRATFSACDDAGITVFAPGTNIISDYPPELAVWSGTSFAAPQLAGAIALGLYVPPLPAP